MTPQQQQIADRLAAELLQLLRAPSADPAQRAHRLALSREAMGAGLAARAIPLLGALAKADPADGEAALLYGVALRMEQRFPEASDVFSAALSRSGAHPALMQGLAQTRYELGLPAADLFARALAAQPGNLELLRNHALALASEGRAENAAQLLQRELAAKPGWLEGHKALAVLNWTSGEAAHFADHFAAAARAQPGNAELWLAWFRMVAQARDWAGAAAILDEAERQLGTTPAIMACRLFLAVESHDDAAAAPLLDQTAHIRGDVTSLCRIRHALRQGDPARAEAEALPLVGGPSAMLYWPYLSLAWRMRGDDRWQWLDRPDDLIAAHDSGLSAEELAELAELLRELHTAKAPYIEQSVRGGTQTDRSVLLRHEPALQRLKARLLELVRGHVAGLPPPDPQHPLLGTPREHLLVEGSWSVRLLRQGYNVPHTHAMGWLSTAFYVSLPSAQDMGPPPAGHIAFGTPPAELGLDIAPYRVIRPEPGRLAIFPSYAWHGTIPFEDGERLMIAFDTRRPAY